MITADAILKENERRKREEEAKLLAPPEPGTFEYWAARNVKIKPKGGGKAIPFRLNLPQRRLVEELESMRRADLPIRLILLKARQWGGSTAIQIYMAWLQIEHSTGLNSLIIAHQISGSEEIKDMFDRMIANFPGNDEESVEESGRALTMKRVGRSGATYRLLERDCKISIGSAERPDSSRGGDYNLVHLSEVGLWKQTKGKKPEDIVRSATSGVLLRPMTMIALESTANGAGTYFHREYLAAKEGESQFRALFIPWFDISTYRKPLADPEAFARELLEKRLDPTTAGRSESGQYHWSLWERGATLEAINWYIMERRKYADHGSMAAEYPSDDIEAFVHSGERVFAPEAVDRLRRNVAEPIAIGEMEGGFKPDSLGPMEIWKFPDEAAAYSDRYLVVVDVGGRSSKADWSVIAVMDRAGDDGRPEIAAQWRGHIDHDILARKAAEIARWYHNALLVIESNTLETHDAERDVDGLQAPYILRELEDEYLNLYHRSSGQCARPGFHTNTSTKPMVIGTLVKYVREGGYVERDRKAVDELIQYERKPNGSFGAYSGCHDDILMTRAIGLYIHECEMQPPRRIMKGTQKGTGRRSQDAFGIF